jgi:hypothetical protein
VKRRPFTSKVCSLLPLATLGLLACGAGFMDTMFDFIFGRVLVEIRPGKVS